jgi:transposase-like protein
MPNVPYGVPVARNGTKGTARRTDAEARKALAAPDFLAGMPLHQIAKKHGVSNTTVRRWAAEIRPAISAGKEDALEVLRGAGRRAAETIVSLVDDEEGRLALAAAIAILDRIGVIKSEAVEVTGGAGAAVAIQVVMTAEERDALARDKGGE